MSLNSIFSQKATTDTKREIVLELLNSDKNLDEKTELDKPLRWSCLRSVQNYIENKQLSKSAEILEDFISQSFRFLISKDRKGRQEYIESLKALSSNLDEKKDNMGNPLLEKA